jgi:hypothetical protein
MEETAMASALPVGGLAGQSKALLRRSIRGTSVMLIVMSLFGAFIVGLLLSQRTVAAEWGRAFGTDHRVTGTVARIIGNSGTTRTCTLDRVVLTWTEGRADRVGYFDVCSDDTHKYPTGKTVSGWAPRADRQGDAVAVNVESRAGAIFGVVLESLMILAVAWLALALARSVWRQIRAPAVLGRRTATDMLVIEVQTTLPNGRRVRNGGRRIVLNSLDGQRLSTIVLPRPDGAVLDAGDELSVISTGRSLFRRRPAGPVGIVRKHDLMIFWSTSKIRADRFAGNRR